jgi:hypothetical protein
MVIYVCTECRSYYYELVGELLDTVLHTFRGVWGLYIRMLTHRFSCRQSTRNFQGLSRSFKASYTSSVSFTRSHTPVASQVGFKKTFENLQSLPSENMSLKLKFRIYMLLRLSPLKMLQSKSWNQHLESISEP